MKAIDGLGHVAIKVKDVDKSMAFYSGVLKFPEMLRLHHDDGSLFLIYLRITDTQYLEIFPNAATDRAPGGDGNGVHHFCLTVDKLEPLLDAIVANGGTLYAWTRTETGRELQPTTTPTISNGLDGNRQAWLQDPDGNRIELMEMAPDCLQYKAIRRLQSEGA
ncbi:VOC family protein [Labrys wisconsinensis]|uniref:Lactoylglutathione lyase n=1 Tax=Labrys wisconsinensis TaxID=425677 RepID=A0ABU0JN81_9HYPH|nr:VOC family protein [Labrys wisconsinensis]MDQ0474749.1 lactoylglutathione lyase [Labrys wisconsinensis]